MHNVSIKNAAEKYTPAVVITTLVLAALLLLLIFSAIGCSHQKEKIKAVVVPKIEGGALDDDIVGEGQLIYKNYFSEAKKYQLSSGVDLFVANGFALYVSGVGKTNAAANLSSLLTDDRFDCSQAYIISTGCAGGAYDKCTYGDVTISSATVDLDCGHTADARDMGNDTSKSTLFLSEDDTNKACKIMNKDLVNKVYAKTANLQLNIPTSTDEYIKNQNIGYGWENKTPSVKLGTHVSSDNYWKGVYQHKNANKACEFYGTPDPYLTTEMEDAAMANTATLYNMGDRFIAIRGIVNQDMFPTNSNPEKFWAQNGENEMSNDPGWNQTFIQTMQNTSDVIGTMLGMIESGEL